ncbi:MAG: hypothetical protein U9R19_12635, partial [Bacteroidota bacterium]|nr:hypothetical protein [Bacteroidota bacterium]
MAKTDFVGNFKADKKIQEAYSGDLSSSTVSPQLAYNKDCLYFNEEQKQIWFWGRIYGMEKLATQYSIRFVNEADFMLQLYLKKGIDIVRRIDGEFTFIITNDTKTLVCRDRHGAGPQFFYSSEFFSSNLFEFRNFNSFTPEPDYHALTTFLSIGYIPSPQSSLKGVQKLGAGFFLTIKDGVQVEKDMFGYQEFLNSNNSCKMSIGDATAEYERLHKEAIEAR